MDAPIAIDQLTLNDDLIGALGLRPIGERRGEALVSTGTNATHRAALRASDELGGAGIELTGDTQTSDVLGSRSDAAARVEHVTEHDRWRASAGYHSEELGLTRQSFATDTSTAAYGAAWTGWRDGGRFELRAFGEQQTVHDLRSTTALDLEHDAYGVAGSFASRPVHALGLAHEFGAGVGMVQASGTAGDYDLDPEMTHTVIGRAKRGSHRFLSAYLHDTVRVIESLDVHGGYVFEHWRWLTNITPIYAKDFGEDMATDASEEISALITGPELGALYRVAPDVTLEATAYRRMRAPTWQQLMRPVQNGSVLTVAGDSLHPETITGAQAGPAFGNGAIEARAVVYWNEIASPIAAVTAGDSLRELVNLGHARETGVNAAASWRIAKPWLAGVGYTFANTRVTEAVDPLLVGKQLAQTPRHRATAMLAFDSPKLVTLTGAVRYVDRRFEDDRNTIVARPFTVVDAMAARKLVRGLAGFVAVENLFDRRYVAQQAGVDTFGAPRLVQIGVRLDSARW